MRPSALLLTPLLAYVLVAQAAAPADTPKKPVTDTYHGVRVTDNYRWLEDAENPAVKHWVEQQNKHARAFLDRLPDLPALEKRVDALFVGASPSFEKLQYANGVLCALSERSLVVLKSEEDAKPIRTLVDVDKLPAKNKAVIEAFTLSEDGKLAAVTISADGIEEGTVHVYETATGKKRPDRVPQAFATAGGDLAWKPDGSGFYYTRFPNATPGGKPNSERYARQEVWFHRLGTKAGDDRYVCGRELPRYAGLSMRVSKDDKHLLVGAAFGSGSDQASWHLLGPSGKLETLAGPKDRVATVDFGPDNTLLLESHEGAPHGRVLKMPLAERKLSTARLLMPQGDVLHTWLVTDRLVYALDRRNGSERLRVFEVAGKELPTVELPPLTAVEELVQLKGDVIVYKVESYTRPPAWFRYDPATRKSVRLPLSETSPIHFRDIEIVREQAISKDRTRVPLTILRPKGCKLDGERPVLLTGYGGFRDAQRPGFQADRRVWFDHGGVWAIAHVRGDGDLGDDWHRVAQGAGKQVVADDFIACSEHLIARKYTRPGRLAIKGGSNGGLLIGMAMTQKPELYAAVIADVGVLDVLRSERDCYGPHCIAEYGTVADARQFKAMLAYSPLQRVKDGTTYPPVWLRTGANDHRVDPYHTWKMAALLQASRTKNPVLLTTVADEGHDATTSPAEDFAFLFSRLGVKYQRPAPLP